MENTLKPTTIQNLTFKGRFKGRKCTFIPKVVSKRFMFTDGFHNRFKTFFTIYIPKLNSRYPRLQVMFHMGNGSSQCQLRGKDPRELADVLEQIVNVLRSDEWLDKAFRVEEISDHLIQTGEWPLGSDEDIVDINEIKESMINSVNINQVDLGREDRVEDAAKEFFRKKGICRDSDVINEYARKKASSEDPK